MVAGAAGAEEIRFNVAPGGFSESTIQGYDFVEVPTSGVALGIEPFGTICPNWIDCPGGGSTYYLGISAPMAQRGVSFYPSYPGAWAPFDVRRFRAAHAPGHSNVTLTVQGFLYPGGLLPDFIETFDITDRFTPIDLEHDSAFSWEGLGEIRILANGIPPVPIFIDDIEATLVEPAPPDESIAAPNDCATRTHGPGATEWPIVNLTSERSVTQDAHDCYYLMLGDEIIDEVCDSYLEQSAASDPLGPYAIEFDWSVGQASTVGCDALAATGHVEAPPFEAANGHWFPFYGESQYTLAFDVVERATLSIDGTLTTSGEAGGQLWLRVLRTDGDPVVVHERLGPSAVGVEQVDDGIVLDPGAYEVDVYAAVFSGQGAAFDVALLFEPAPTAVPGLGPIGTGLGGAWIIALAWRRLMRRTG